MRIALFEPEIAGNVGAILRLGACLGVPVDLIEPLGFLWDDARVRRTAMDYIDHVAITRHADWPAFHASIGAARLVLLTTKGSVSAYDFASVLMPCCCSARKAPVRRRMSTPPARAASACR